MFVRAESEERRQGADDDAAAAQEGAAPPICDPGGGLIAPPHAGPEDAAAARIATFERELRARGGDARLQHEIGRLEETVLGSRRRAALALQNAHRRDRRHVPTLRAARRLFAAVGHWELVAELLAAEAEAAADDGRRAAFLVERGVVLDAKLRRPEAAARSYEQALEADAGSVAAWLQLLSLHEGDAAPLAVDFERLARATSDPALAARALAEAAALRGDRLGDVEGATRLHLAANAAEPADRVAARAALLHLERHGDEAALATLLEAEAQQGGEEGAAAAYRLARLHMRHGGDEEALAALLRARALAPSDPLVLGELARLHEERHEWAALADVLEAQVRVAGDQRERIALLLALGALYDEKLERPEDAIRAQIAILAIDPRHGAALSRLGRLYHQAENWPGLLATFDAEAAAADDPKRRAARLFKGAVLLEEKLDRSEEAIARHEAILELVPGYLPSMQALSRLLAAQSRWADLVRLLEQELAAASEPAHRFDLLARIATIQEKELGDLRGAIATHRRMLGLGTEHHPTIRSLARLAEAAGAWDDLVVALEQEAAQTADQRRVIALLHRAAEVLEEKIGDRDRAAATWQRVLTLAPAYLPALRALGAIHAQRGRWEELAAMHRREAAVTVDARAAAALLYEVGAICEQRLCDERRALAAWNEALALDPRHLPTLRRLAQVHRARADWDGVVDVLRREAAARTAPAEKAAVLCRIAEILEERLQRKAQAREAWAEALRIEPDLVHAWHALERLDADDDRALAALLDRQTAIGEVLQRIRAHLRLAAHRLWRLGDPDGAAASCEAALQLLATPGADPAVLVAPGQASGAPAHTSTATAPAQHPPQGLPPEGVAPALTRQTRRRAAAAADAPRRCETILALTLLSRIRTAQGDRRRRADARAALAAALTDPAAAAALLVAAHDDRAAAGVPQREAELRRAFSLAPTDERAFASLEGALAALGDDASLAALWEARAAAEPDLGLRVHLLHRLALLHARQGDLAAAGAALEQALANAPDDLAVLAEQEALFARTGAWRAVHANLLAQASHLRDAALAASLLRRAAEVAESRLGDAGAAREALRAALDRWPDPEASAHLEALAGVGDDPAALVAVLERRATRLSGAAAGAAWLAAARLRQDRLGQREEALTALDRALAHHPHLPEALERRGRLLLALGRWGEAAQALEARVALGGDLAEVHLTLGQLHLERLGDPATAARHLQAAVDAAPGQRAALRALARIHLAARNHPGARDALEKLAALEADPGVKAAIHEELARIAEEGFGDPAAAAACTERVLALDPARRAAHAELARRYQAAGDPGGQASALERWAERAPPKEAAAILCRAASIHAGALRRPERALALWRAALERDPACREALRALADRGGDDAHAHHLRLLELDPGRQASWLALLRIERDADAPDRAFQAAAIAHILGPLPPQDEAWFEKRRAAAAPPRSLPADVRAALVERRDAPLRGLALLLEPHLRRLERRRTPPRGDLLLPDHPIRRALEASLRVVGADPGAFLIAESPFPDELSVECGEEVVLHVGTDLLGVLGEGARRFLLGRFAYQVAEARSFLHRLHVEDAAAILAAAVALGSGSRGDDPALVRRLGRALPRRVRKAIVPLAEAAAADMPDFAAFVEAERRAADRAGLLLCADPACAIACLLDEEAPGARPGDTEAVAEALTRAPRATALLRWAATDRHLELRRRLGTAIAD